MLFDCKDCDNQHFFLFPQQMKSAACPWMVPLCHPAGALHLYIFLKSLLVWCQKTVDVGTFLRYVYPQATWCYVDKPDWLGAGVSLKYILSKLWSICSCYNLGTMQIKWTLVMVAGRSWSIMFSVSISIPRYFICLYRTRMHLSLFRVMPSSFVQEIKYGMCCGNVQINSCQQPIAKIGNQWSFKVVQYISCHGLWVPL